MIEVLATFCAGTFFGAAVYINLVQHPATLETGGDFASRFFSPMYRKAAPMQITLALAGTVLGFAAWFLSGSLLWLIGAILLVSVMPITVFLIKPINHQLLNPTHDLAPQQAESLLRQWNPRHWIRSIVSGLSFLVYLGGMSG